jgi:hypothetical protein
MGRKAVQEIAAIRVQYDGLVPQLQAGERVLKNPLEWLVCIRIAGSHLYKDSILVFFSCFRIIRISHLSYRTNLCNNG